MVQDQHKQITGYRDLQQDEIDAMNAIKEREASVALLWQQLQKMAEDPEVAITLDKRWADVARTHFEEGFSALVRSVAKPKSPFDAKLEEFSSKAPDAAAELNNLIK